MAVNNVVSSQDILFVICHVIWQEHMIQDSYKIIGGRSSREVTTLPYLVAISILVTENLCFHWLKSQIPHACLISPEEDFISKVH